MKTKLLQLLFSFLFLYFVNSASAGEYVTRKEYDGLAAKVAMLESVVLELRGHKVDAITQEVVASMSVSQKANANVVEQVVEAVKMREQKVNFPWMDLLKWAPIKKGLGPDEVIGYLGRPTLNEPSMHKRIDYVYTYVGKRPSTGKKVEGIIRFYKGQVVEVEKPVIE